MKTLIQRTSNTKDINKISIPNIQKIDSKNDSKSINEQILTLKNQNQNLKKQLQKISNKLDQQVNKRNQQISKKALNRPKEISQMQLQNAYKKYKIYKKQAQQYKKKLQAINQDTKTTQYQAKINQCIQENNNLKEQLKYYIKISKQQEKGLVQLGVDGYLKIVKQNQSLRQQVKRLKKNADSNRRIIVKQGRSRVNTINDKQNNNYDVDISQNDIKFEQNLKKRIKTQQNVEGQTQLNDLLQQKVQKDFQKIKNLLNEKKKSRQLIDNLKIQINEKQKQIIVLKQKNVKLKKQNDELFKKLKQFQNENQLKLQTNKKYKKQIEQKYKINQQLQTQSKRVWKQEQKQIEKKNSKRSISKNYPRIQQKGVKQENNLIKWNHQNYSSKIKQLHVLINNDHGFIKDIHARYEKGQPKKYNNYKGKYKIFVCHQDQYIILIQGAFAENYLQYLYVVTNHRRVQSFGNIQQYQNQPQSQHFKFDVQKNQFPGGLFGQNDEYGIRKLGCFIHKQ